MKSIKTLIISGAVTLAMALPLSGMAMNHKHSKHHGDREAAKACIFKHVQSGKSSKIIRKAYCVNSDSDCLSKVNDLIQKAQGLNFSPEMVVAITAKCVDTVCNKVSVACKMNNCMSDESGS